MGGMVLALQIPWGSGGDFIRRTLLIDRVFPVSRQGQTNLRLGNVGEDGGLHISQAGLKLLPWFLPWSSACDLGKLPLLFELSVLICSDNAASWLLGFSTSGGVLPSTWHKANAQIAFLWCLILDCQRGHTVPEGPSGT